MTLIQDSAHPYFCSTVCYHSNACGETFNSFVDFLDEYGDLDDDMNAVFRWDVRADTCDDWEECGGPDECKDECGSGTFTLEVFWVAQRKGHMFSTQCLVTAEDEAELKRFLARKADYLRNLWSPFL